MIVPTRTLALLVWCALIRPLPAIAQGTDSGFAFRSMSYASIVTQSAATASGYGAVVEQTIRENFPNELTRHGGDVAELREALVAMKGAGAAGPYNSLKGNLFEDLIAYENPRFHVADTQNDKLADLVESCHSGAHCVGGQRLWQAKNLNDPSDYLKVVQEGQYRDAAGIIVPADKYDDIMALCEKRGVSGCNVIRKAPNGLTSEKVDRVASAREEAVEGDRQGMSSSLVASLQLAMWLYSVRQACSGGQLVQECVGAAGIGLVQMTTFQPTSTLLSRSLSLSDTAAGLAVAGLWEIGYAINQYGFTWDAAVTAGIGIASNFASFAFCGALGFAGPFGPFLSLGCILMTSMALRAVGHGIWDNLKGDELLSAIDDLDARLRAKLVTSGHGGERAAPVRDSGTVVVPTGG